MMRLLIRPFMINACDFMLVAPNSKPVIAIPFIALLAHKTLKISGIIIYKILPLI